MNKMALVLAGVVVGGLALAAPTLRLTSSSRLNGMALGEVVNIAAYSQLPIISRSNTGSSVVLVYKGKDATEPFKFHQSSFEKQGWKVGHSMGGDMGGAMDKPGSAMDKPADGTMNKPADTMGGTSGSTMNGTMDKGLEVTLTLKKLTLTIKSNLVGADQIKVSFDLK